MATGFTYPVEEGKITELRPFALNCARAFGALIHMRDDAMDAPIVPRTESDYYAKTLASATARLKELLSMTPEQASALERSDRESQNKQKLEWRETMRVHRERHEAMIAKVEAWAPPTASHAGLKKFMLEQLTMSLPREGAEYLRPIEPRHPPNWLREQIIDAREAVERAAKALAEERERVRESNEWASVLEKSLRGTGP